MLTDSGVIRTYFAKLGLESEIADIYLALHAHGPQSIAALARNSGVERTRIYRLIDKLMDSNLVELENHAKRGFIKAAPIANLSILIKAREQELRSLQDELNLIEQVLARNSISDPLTRTQLYKGIEGCKQMLWNETKASTEVAALLHDTIHGQTHNALLEAWVNRCDQHTVRYQCVINDQSLMQDVPKLPKYWETRYVAPSSHMLTLTCTTYDEVIAYYTWRNDDFYGVEIYNKAAAAMQRQLWALLWDKAEALQTSA
jgi:DNA-binding MarR family transcriptional regulator